MAKYLISGVWKNSNNVITHYAIHSYNADGKISRAEKTSKLNAVKLLDNKSNSAYTILWNYKKALWFHGAAVEVIDDENKGKYLRSIHDGTVRDNLSHLIDFDWIKL